MHEEPRQPGPGPGMHYKAWTTGASGGRGMPTPASPRWGRPSSQADQSCRLLGQAPVGGVLIGEARAGCPGVPRLRGAAGVVAPQAQDQEGDYIFIRILNKSPRPPVSQAPAFMVIGDELPTMPGQVQVVLGPDPKLIFICSCVYNFAHSLPFLFLH